tara:strand:- start:1927 stop:2163 length:237 start_codon:yes stop_codon:yes gene_type:complete
MNEIDLINILKKKFKHLKKKRISLKDDLVKELILDSLELMEFMSFLEKKKYLKLREYTNKERDFKLSNILKFINKIKK